MTYQPQSMTDDRLAKAHAMLEDIERTGVVPDRIRYYFADALEEIRRLQDRVLDLEASCHDMSHQYE